MTAYFKLCDKVSAFRHVSTGMMFSETLSSYVYVYIYIFISTKM